MGIHEKTPKIYKFTIGHLEFESRQISPSEITKIHVSINKFIKYQKKLRKIHVGIKNIPKILGNIPVGTQKFLKYWKI